MPEKSFTILMVKLAVRREIIKKQMEVTDGKVRVLVASFGTLSSRCFHERYI
jgi:hypothetical protein